MRVWTSDGRGWTEERGKLKKPRVTRSLLECGHSLSQSLAISIGRTIINSIIPPLLSNIYLIELSIVVDKKAQRQKERRVILYIMGDITIHLLVESSLLGNNNSNAAEQILSSSSLLFQFRSTSHTLPADTSLIELMNDHVLPTIIKHSSAEALLMQQSTEYYKPKQYCQCEYVVGM